ncbi:MAG: TAT-variant-translocated molybdopterin oxidoreductase [Phycisphaerae bacterium]
MAIRSDRGSGQAYWRSLDELAGTPEFRQFVAREFPNLPELAEAPSRRQFLKVMGASLAMAGLTGCRWPKEEIVPFAGNPAGRVPGIPVQYATAMELGGVGLGLLVTSYDGRPIKIEGNDQHPISLGASSAIAQASVLDLYDPDRSQACVERGAEQNQIRTWDQFAAFAAPHFASLRQRKGEGLCVLSEASDSPSYAEMRTRFAAAFPSAGWFEYEPLSRDNERRGTTDALGAPHRPQYDLSKANIVVSLDADFLMTHPASLLLTRQFARRRGDAKKINRLYVFESGHSITGSNADQRVAIRGSAIPAAAVQLAAELARLGLTLPGEAGALARGIPPAADVAVIAAAARDLLAHKGASVLIAGDEQPPELHALCCALNEALGNVGQTVSYTPAPDAKRPAHVDAIAALVERLKSGAVDTLVLIGGNPVYDAPADLDLAAALAKVPNTIHLGHYRDETGRECRWHVNRAHYLESWGDARGYDGTVSIVQPLIAAIYDGKTPIELLALMAGDEVSNGYEIVRRTLRTRFAANATDFDVTWRGWLNDGVIRDTASARSGAKLSGFGWVNSLIALAQSAKPAEAGSFELAFRPDYKLHDGRFANNGWLQELPDPMSKLVWDNAVYVAPLDAKRLGIGAKGDSVKLEVGGQSLQMPAFVMPGHAAGSLTVTLGWGRTHGGAVSKGAGFNAYKLRTRENWHFAAARATASGSNFELVGTQDHHAITTQVGSKELAVRADALIREVSAEEFAADPHDAMHGHTHPLPVAPLFQPHEYVGQRWGMSIDLSKCTGCSACVTACQAENNIPVVGKREVSRGREMHWIRVDRYFKGAPESASARHQPLTCHHCENAPCETVCPVNATVHDHEGLNAMVYNRCVGTRYCSNNCPFKVRRFNWFYNHHGPYHPRSGQSGEVPMKGVDVTILERMAFNPDVTVRSRGVMEKCTYCVQRINRAKIVYKNEKLEIPDGVITPACAQACPAEAIGFGDLAKVGSAVAAAHVDERAFSVLDELNLNVRTKYLARLNNPALAGSAEATSGGSAHHAG